MKRLQKNELIFQIELKIFISSNLIFKMLTVAASSSQSHMPENTMSPPGIYHREQQMQVCCNKSLELLFVKYVIFDKTGL